MARFYKLLSPEGALISAFRLTDITSVSSTLNPTTGQRVFAVVFSNGVFQSWPCDDAASVVAEVMRQVGEG